MSTIDRLYNVDMSVDSYNFWGLNEDMRGFLQHYLIDVARGVKEVDGLYVLNPDPDYRESLFYLLGKLGVEIYTLETGEVLILPPADF